VTNTGKGGGDDVMAYVCTDESDIDSTRIELHLALATHNRKASESGTSI
jgi:hypothetical protein